MRVAVALIFAYLIGSVLPADLLARTRGVDIRAVGTGNPGATNALRELGLVPGLLTGAYDASVGLVSMYVAWRLDLPVDWMYVAGLAALLGHIYPVFSRFHGGQGMAAATGMLLYGMGVAVTRGWLTAPGLALLGVVALVVFYLTRSASDVGVAAVPLLMLEMLFARSDWHFGAFMTALAAIIWATQLGIARKEHLLRLAEPVRDRLARLHSHAS